MEARLDKRLNGITTIIKAGMKLVSENSRDIRALAAAPARTDRKFALLLNSRNGNGHKDGRK